MDKLEKVIKGLECCYGSFPKCKGCPVCPYEKICYHDKACEDLLRDALELLKEQKPMKVKDFSILIGSPTRYFGVCPSCGERLEKRDSPNFCGHCGDRITWKDGEQE